MNQQLRERYDMMRKRLRAATYHIAEAKEPLQLVQELYYNSMALRGEMTTIMDLLAKGQKFDEDNYMEQMITRLNETTDVLCTAAQIMVDPFGLVIDLKNIRSDNA